ncbi:Fibronectin, type III [Kalmanozyma brasiliensis GHG001]|uniref:Uncharacterized protein n=1 Tax=Kalmanozyma brasiliensis (strain GHG001) TaxID=1365824 RepID=V5EJX7_KALBG|nr:Fibronectin, type III [Kalmanozyma brasiliensis GHG001]EST05135.1 Fibronectin, type III [Kalmanozyma brasiliensis GHG001]
MSAHYVGQIAPNYVHSTMQANSDDDSFTFTVGKLDAGMAILIGDKASLIEFPSLLLPSGVSSGSVVNIRVMRNDQQERRQKDEFDQLQEDILHTFGQQPPKAPALRLRNVTQTSVTLEWDRLSLATATLLSLDIYRNGERLAPIPNPLHNTSTKLSGLDLNAEYTFHLVLKTTAGTLTSPLIKTRTHTISDTSGISVCFGHVAEPELLEASKQALTNMKAKWSDRIQIDTTHYVCTDPRNPGAQEGSQGAGYAKAMQLSIPAVLPHWIFACHDQKKMVGISPFYLDQDPPNASSIKRSVEEVLGKQAPASSATEADTSGSPPPPVEKEPSSATTTQDAPLKSTPFAADDVPPSNKESVGVEEVSSSAPPPPIITTSAPSEDGDAEPQSTPAPPQVVITSSESSDRIAAAAEGESTTEDAVEQTQTTEGAEEDADGEMDEVSLGGPNGDDEQEEERRSY